MTVYDAMTVDPLLGAKGAHDDLRIRTAELAVKYCVQERFVCEKLIALHAEKMIRLSAYHESGAVKSLEEQPNPEYFFAYMSDGNYKRLRPLLKGAELLEKCSSPKAEEPEPPKRSIGFHI